MAFILNTLKCFISSAQCFCYCRFTSSINYARASEHTFGWLNNTPADSYLYLYALLFCFQINRDSINEIRNSFQMATVANNANLNAIWKWGSNEDTHINSKWMRKALWLEYWKQANLQESKVMTLFCFQMQIFAIRSGVGGGIKTQKSLGRRMWWDKEVIYSCPHMKVITWAPQIPKCA